MQYRINYQQAFGGGSVIIDAERPSEALAKALPKEQINW